MEINPTIETIYFGGGTPSLLSELELETILTALHQHFNVAPNVEITLEANPDDLTREKLKSLLKLGVNRLSIGIQSIENEHLLYMNRAHSANEAIFCIEESLGIGFKHLNVDMIFGVPGLTTTNWTEQLQKISSYPIQHISAYALTVETKTALATFIKKGKSKPIDDTLTAEQFLLTASILESFGFEHYELSNYARNGEFSKHNTAYWQNKPYLGLGPSAHSYIQNERSWNIANNAIYFKNISGGIDFRESESLTIINRYNEYLMTGLRTKWGINLDYIAEKFGEVLLTHLINCLPNINDSFYVQTEKWIILTKEGWLWSDSILERLIVEEE